MFNLLINLFFPKACAGCANLLLDGENVICTACRHHIPTTNHFKNPHNEAMRKFYGKLPVECAAAFVYYHKKGIVQQLIHNLKYKGQQDIGTAMAHWMAPEISKLETALPFDTIIVVPLHPKKRKQRGYNQVTAFGKELSNSLNLPFDEEVLIRKVYSKTQTAKNLLGRAEVSKHEIFAVQFTEKHHNCHYLLLDDVLTTGATLEACGRAVLQIPGAKLSILCIAMSHS